jgi:DNA polymerase I
MSKLLIIDGNAILHRAFHAMPEWRNSNGEAISGVYGFFSMLIKAREDLSPDYLVVVFDCPEPNFRHSLYIGYQSNRAHDEQMSIDIWGQVEKIETVLEKLAVPVFKVPGYEADDIVGTICEQAKKEVGEVVVATGDRDLFQLVDEKVKVYMPVKGVSEAVLLDTQAVCQKMGVNPDQIVDYKALVGDGSDGYPGVSGIGPKTACELLARYKNLESIYKNSFEIKESTRKKLVEGFEMGQMSQKLATIVRDAPVKFVLKEANMPTTDKFVSIFDQSGHKSLRARVQGISYTKEMREEANKEKKDLQESLF